MLGPKKDGLIDFALTSTTVTDPDCIDTVNKILNQEPNKDGGRVVKFHIPVPVFDDHRPVLSRSILRSYEIFLVVEL